MDTKKIDLAQPIAHTLRVVAAGEFELFQTGQVWVAGPLVPDRIADKVFGLDLDSFTLGRSGNIDPEQPQVTPGADNSVQVAVKWPVVCPCPCDKITVRQEIKGYIELTDPAGTASKLTAMDIVIRGVSGLAPGQSAEADDIRTRRTQGQTGETDFIPDVGAHGTSFYPAALLGCENLDGGRSRVTFNDEPGSSMRVGPNRPFRTAKINLTFRTTILCDGTPIGQLVWHVRYSLPAAAGATPDVGLGE